MKPIISVEGLGKSYTIRHEGQTPYKSLREEIFKLPKRLLSRGAQSQEEFWALKDVNFDIMPGDRVGIIGRNGAGKSTLLKLLSRITEPTTGRITMRGRVASLLEVGTGFHAELTGRENIYLNGAILGMTRAEVRRKFDEIVDFAGVEKFLDTPVKRYSSGMYVRLAFAVAANLEPEILIVDEVLAVGDAEFQKKCLGKMEEVSKGQGRTVLFVSHNMAAVQQLCGRALLMKEGTVVADGAVPSLLQMYLQKEDGVCKELSFGFIIIERMFIDSKKLSVDEDFEVVLEYRRKSGKEFGFCLEFSDMFGNSCFITISPFYDKNSGVIKCKIKSGMLNNGVFWLGLSSYGRDFSDTMTHKNIMRIEIADGVRCREQYWGTYAGLSRPAIEWT